MRNVDGRLQDLILETQELSSVNDGHGDEHPSLLEWRRRAETAVAEKLGEKHPLADELRRLSFFHFSMVIDQSPTTAENQRAFTDDLNRAVAALKAALEAEAPRMHESTGPRPFIHIDNTGATATANAVARVTAVSSSELRQVIAGSDALTASERSEGVGAVPGDNEDIDMERADKLLGLALKAKDLFVPILSFLLGNANRISF